MTPRAKRVLLVTVPSIPRPDDKTFTLRGHEAQPLSLIYLAEGLMRAGFPVETVTADLHTQAEILETVQCSDADLVGISTFTDTYPNALEVVKLAKSQGKRVILGGPHTRYFAPEMIKRGVDGVVVGDGELAIVDFVRGQPSESIPNFWYMTKNGPTQSQAGLVQATLQDLPIPTLGRQVIHMEEYFQTHQRLRPQSQHQRPASINTQRGCPWRDESGGCTFCSIGYKGWVGRRAEQIWQDVSWLVETYGVDFLWDPSDCFTGHPEWVAALATAKPTRGNWPKWSIYARVDGINGQVVDHLLQIGIDRVYLGIESGSQEVLDKMNKGTTLEENRQAVRLLTQAGINSHISLIVGFPGENKETLEASYRHTAELVGLGAGIVTVHTFTPWPGNSFFAQLVSQHPELGESDLIDPWHLRRLWHHDFCDIDYRLMLDYAQKMMSLAPESEDLTTKIEF